MNIGVGAGVDVEALLQENARLKQEKSVLKKVTPHTYVDRWGECPSPASLREPALPAHQCYYRYITNSTPRRR